MIAGFAGSSSDVLQERVGLCTVRTQQAEMVNYPLCNVHNVLVPSVRFFFYYIRNNQSGGPSSQSFILMRLNLPFSVLPTRKPYAKH